jgi:ArsR family transcriptional regulator
MTSAVTTLDQNQAMEQLVALADPTRLALLTLLREREQCVCHLVARLDLKQSVVSHHLGILRRARLVMVRPHPADRRWLYYRLHRPALAALGETLAWLSDEHDYDPTPLPCPADITPEAR